MAQQASALVNELMPEIDRDIRTVKFIEAFEAESERLGLGLSNDIKADNYNFMFENNDQSLILSVHGEVPIGGGPFNATIRTVKMPAGRSGQTHSGEKKSIIVPVTSPEALAQAAQKAYQEASSEVGQKATKLMTDLKSWHRAYMTIKQLESRYSGAAEERMNEAKADFYTLTKSFAPVLEKAISNWVEVHNQFQNRPDLTSIVPSVVKILQDLRGAMTDLRDVDSVARAVTMALNVAHNNGMIMETIGITPQQLEELSNTGGLAPNWDQGIKGIR